ncbi:Triose-phosphate Transporter [Mortierella sp. NVP41]|nr:Triose-phosphate Transporter [Mortierella sp. NVP41]
MTGHEAAAGAAVREGVSTRSLNNPFEAEEDPFQPHFNNNEHGNRHHDQSYIDTTADSYSPIPSVAAAAAAAATNNNPFADSNRAADEATPGTRARGASDYDSFESHDEEDDDYNDDDYTTGSSSGSGYATSDYDDTDSEDDNAGNKKRAGGLKDTSYREPEDGDDDQEVEDTQQLLLSSSNTKMGGMGMGMRAGETGTGTMIGLDLEPHGDGRAFGFSHQKDEYDTLPLSTVDHHRRRHRRHRRRRNNRDKGEQQDGTSHDEEDDNETDRIGRSGKRKSRGGKKKRRRAEDGLGGRGDAPVLGLGAIRAEQVAALAKKQVRVQMAWNVFYVFAWYSCSTALSFYNKWLFSPQHHGFTFPLFTTSLHMVAQFTLSSITLTLLPALRPKAAPSPKDFGTKIVPCAVASGLDIGLSNSSLKTITLAFYKRPTWTLAGVISVICVGLFMMVMSEVDFVLIGFIQVMMAAVLGGLRWSLTQMLLERTETKSGSLANPISTIFFLSPIMGICLCVVAAIFEGFGTIFRSEFFATPASAMSTLGLLFLGGIFAFMMVLAEFNLIARTSVVTLSVLGIVKEVMTVVISSMVFHDQLTLINILGLFVTLTGIGFYHFMKLRQMKSKARRAAKELADAELAKATKKKERALERKRRRDQQRSRRGLKTSGGTTDPALDGDEDESNPFGDQYGLNKGLEEEEVPWNHSLPPRTAATVRQKDQDAFVLDDDELEAVFCFPLDDG